MLLPLPRGRFTEKERNDLVMSSHSHVHHNNENVRPTYSIQSPNNCDTTKREGDTNRNVGKSRIPVFLPEHQKQNINPNPKEQRHDTETWKIERDVNKNQVKSEKKSIGANVIMEGSNDKTRSRDRLEHKVHRRPSPIKSLNKI